MFSIYVRTFSSWEFDVPSGRRNRRQQEHFNIPLDTSFFFWNRWTFIPMRVNNATILKHLSLIIPIMVSLDKSNLDCLLLYIKLSTLLNAFAMYIKYFSWLAPIASYQRLFYSLGAIYTKQRHTNFSTPTHGHSGWVICL